MVMSPVEDMKAEGGREREHGGMCEWAGVWVRVTLREEGSKPRGWVCLHKEKTLGSARAAKKVGVQTGRAS